MLFLLAAATFAQSEIHKNAVGKFHNFNKGDFEQIYQAFSPKMKMARTKKQYFAFLSKVKKENAALLFLELFNYVETPHGKSKGSYNGKFENGILTVRITTNSGGEIIGLYIKKAAIL